MKSKSTSVLTVAVFLMMISAVSASGFQDVLDTPAIQTPLAAKSLLNGVAAAGKRLVCVGWKGDIVYSDDMGKSWRQAAVPVSSDLVAVFFPSPAQGWAVGHDGVVLHSSDAGTTWVKQFDGRAAARAMVEYYELHPLPENASSIRSEIDSFAEQGPDKPFLDVWFENETTGFIVGAYNLIFHTEDGGKSWEPWFDRTENPGFLNLYSIRPVGKDLFIAGEQGTVLKLDRKKGVFRSINPPYTGSFFGVTGRSDVVVVFGLRGNAFMSTDAGHSWKKIDTGAPTALTGATVMEDGAIVLVSAGGQVLQSSDGGKSFVPGEVEPPLITAFGVAAFDRDKISVVGIQGAEVRNVK
jgi:photosystem II stability/assembly factor-like uncharacterized protein